MKDIDKKYILLQFENLIYKKEGLTFQYFFEAVMQEVYPDFERVKSYGNRGDKKNDGFRPDVGEFYQVYAPEDPKTKQADAVKKMRADFEALKKHWGQFFQIKKFYFCFNDKYKGAADFIHTELKTLEKEHPEIKFGLFSPKNMENLIFKIEPAKLALMGFDIDQRNAIKVASHYLEKIKREIEEFEFDSVLKEVVFYEKMLSDANDEEIELSFKLLLAKAYFGAEKPKEAIKILEELKNNHPNDIRPLLGLAKNYNQFLCSYSVDDLLNEISRIDKDSVEYKLVELTRIVLENPDLSLNYYNELQSSMEPSVLSRFFHLRAVAYGNTENFELSIEYINKAIKERPKDPNLIICRADIVNCYFFKKGKYFVEPDDGVFFKEIEEIIENDQLPSRIKARAINVLLQKELFHRKAGEKEEDIERLFVNLLDCCHDCWFDKEIDNFISILIELGVVLSSSDYLNRLCEDIVNSGHQPSKQLGDFLFLSFALQSKLQEKGLDFFAKKSMGKYSRLICKILQNDIEGFLNIAEMGPFVHFLCLGLPEFPDFCFQIIQKVEDSELRNRFLLHYHFKYQEFEKALECGKRLDFEKLDMESCFMVADASNKVKSYADNRQILIKILEKTSNDEIILRSKISLFSVCQELSRHKECVEIGNELFSDIDKLLELSGIDNELLRNFFVNYLVHCNHTKSYEKALENLNACENIIKLSFKDKAGLVTSIYIDAQQYDKALKYIVDSFLKEKKITSEMFFPAYFNLVRLSNVFPHSSLQEIVENCFVKISGIEDWYFIGEGNCLDATRISRGENEEKYNAFYSCKVGGEVVFSHDVYNHDSKPRIVEKILNLENYIMDRASQQFVRSTMEDRINGAYLFKVDSDDLNSLPDILRNFLERQTCGLQKEDVFNNYYEHQLPLSICSLLSGSSLTSACAYIATAGKGFIRSNIGNESEISNQLYAAAKIIDGQKYIIDGLSALVLAESGLLQEILLYVPNYLISQATINMLYKYVDKVSTRGTAGSMGFVNGEIKFFPSAEKEAEKLKTTVEEAILFLETDDSKIYDSPTLLQNKEVTIDKMFECFDACYKGLKENIIVYTDDYLTLSLIKELFLPAKEIPDYCSTHCLVRSLLNRGLVSVDKYFQIMEHLVLRRFKHIFLTQEDLYWSVFGFKGEKYSLHNVKRLNLYWLLSEEYGVDQAVAISFIGNFIAFLILKGGIVSEYFYDICVSILSNFLLQKNKQEMCVKLKEYTVNRVKEIEKYGSDFEKARKMKVFTLMMEAFQDDSMNKYFDESEGFYKLCLLNDV